ncbi:MAG: hypothetical protein Q9220_001697 [cf. Caloplaca sp. 1 TL-2023]
MNPAPSIPADNGEQPGLPRSEALDVKHPTSPLPPGGKQALTDIDSPEITLGEEIPPSSSAPAQSPLKRAQLTSMSRQAVASKYHKEQDDGQDELSLPEAAEAAGNGMISKSSQKKKRPLTKSSANKSNADSSELDHALPELPTEKYQPRPSRSRSTFAAEGLLIPADFSKKPEAIANAKANVKRRKVNPDSDFNISGGDSVAQDESRANHNPDLGTLEETTEIGALTKCSSPMKAELDTHSPEKYLQGRDSTMALTESSPSRPPPSKKSRGRPKKQTAPVPPAEHSTGEDGLIKEDKVVESRDLIGPVSDQIPAKRGRKRKKLPVDESSEPLTHDAPPEAGTSHDVEGTEATESSVLRETDSNVQHEHSLPVEGFPEAENATSKPILSPDRLPDIDMTRAGSIAKQAKPLTGPIAEKLNETKSIYRVGLSKRHRIAPLLRVVRK